MFGDFPPTSVFPERQHDKVQSKQELLSTSKWAVHSILGSSPFETPPEVAAELRAITQDELDHGKCRGPFTKAQMEKRYPDGWVSGVRFPVVQKDRARGCDDYCKYGQNGTGSTPETVDTEGQDSIVAVGKLWTCSVDSDRKVKIKLKNGMFLEGVLHESMELSDLFALLARIIDLARAYKQLARRPEDANMSIFAQMNEDDIWEFFEALVLGFGSRDAVFSFNLMARALRFILNKLLWTPATHFYHDFSQVDVSLFSIDSCRSTQRLFDLLGWEYKKKADQLLPPSAIFTPLGVSIDFSEAGFVTIANTEKRRQRIIEEVSRLRAMPSIPAAPIHSLVGVCTFAEAQTSGRTGAMILREVRNTARLSGADGHSKLVAALGALAEYTAAVRPRRIRISVALPPVIILTDAASETAGVSVGAVIIDPVNSLYQYFGKRLQEPLAAKWRSTGKDQVICQAELLAVPIALTTWSQAIEGRDLLIFIDNDPAREALIRGSSVSNDSSAYVHTCRLLSAKAGVAPWYARVASPSNIADLPSRGDFCLLDRSGAVRVEPSLLAVEPALAYSDF